MTHRIPLGTTGISEWSGLRYAVYTPQDGKSRGNILVEQGLSVGNAHGGGQKFALKPAMDNADDYVVAGCVSGTDQGAYMGIESTHKRMGGSYNVFAPDSFAAHPRQDGNGQRNPYQPNPLPVLPPPSTRD